MGNSRSDVYFAAREPKEVAAAVLSKSNDWFNGLDTLGYLDKLRNSWCSYYGAYFTDTSDGHRITFSGEQGEYVNLPVNHFRNLARHMLVMVTATRPSMEARATNTDYKSLCQAKLANGLLDYYMREKRLEDYLHRAIEMAIVLGSGYIKIEWNATSGEIYDFNEETNTPIYQGDVQFLNLSPFDVVFDSTKEDPSQHNWVVCRSSKCRYDLIAKYPEFKERILALPSKVEKQNFNFANPYYDDTDDVFIYEFYHKRTESMPDGRYLLFLENDISLMDSPMPYRNLPVYRVSPSDIMGTPFGYSDIFDVMPIQDAINTLYSAIMTNQTAFAVPNIISPRGADVNPTLLASGLNFLEYNVIPGGGPPAPLQLAATPKEVFDFLGMLEQTAETISGVNSVSRGDPAASLKSGNALALVQSMSLQFMSGLQQSYVKLIEDVGTGLINVLKDFASVPRVAAIVGIANRTEMKQFKGEDLESINRVIVDVGNPLSRCLEKDTPIIMFDGTIKMVQDIVIGDILMGPDSKPRTVDVVETGKDMMYKVTSKDKHRKIQYGCNQNHVLTLKYCSDDYRYNAKKGDILDISVTDFLKLSDSHQMLLQGFTVGVEFPEKHLPIPPYILGSWLGDGTSAATAITTMDEEIRNEWFNYAQQIGMQFRTSTSTSSGRAKTYFITSGQSSGKSDRNPFMNELHSMELLNNKHIPQWYKNSSRQQRLELLAGIIDTDGHKVPGTETLMFTQKCDVLTTDVVHLAKSLGFRVTYKKYLQKASKLIKTESLINKVTIGGDTWEIPCRLLRKQTKPKEKARDWHNYGISVEPVGYGDYYGFTLREEPHFLLGDFTVTHNTTAGKLEMASELLQMGLFQRPEQYFTVIKTGNLDAMTDGIDHKLLLIKAENEQLLRGEIPPAVATEDHALHINEHGNVLSDPELKKDATLVKNVLDHIQEHIELLKTVDPNLLMILGQQPIQQQQPPVDQNGNPIPQQGPQGPPPPAPTQAQKQLEATMTPSSDPAAQLGIQDPKLPSPPEPFSQLPVQAKDVGLQS